MLNLFARLTTLLAVLLFVTPVPAFQAPAAPAKKAPAKKGKAPKKPRHDESGRTYMGREIADVMSYLGADWLVRESREEEERPEEMLDALDLKKGDVVADIGAGVGYTSLRIAKRVGAEGKVLATDIQPEMIRMLKLNIKAEKIENVEPILCTVKDTKLPDGKVDLAIMVDVYHECSDPVETLKGVRKALKPGGRLVLIEFRAEDPEVPIKPEHKMTVEQVRKEIEPQGFDFKEVKEFLPWQHILIFSKNAK
jgi:ubiquinone/menaquinone biosynthesis C-methylase UbiE